MSWLDQFLFNSQSIQGIPVATTPPATGQVLAFNGSIYAPIDPSGASTGNLYGTFADRPASAPVGTAYYASDAPDATYTGSFWQTRDCYGNPMVPPPAAGSWTQSNFAGGTTLAMVADKIVLNSPGDVGGDTSRIATLALSSAIYTLTAHFIPLPLQANNSSAGICIFDGTKVIEFKSVFVSGGNTVQVTQRNSAGSFHANAYTAAWNVVPQSGLWFVIQNTGTSRNYSWLPDGKTPVLAWTEATGAWLTETSAGITVDPISGGGVGITLDSWNITYP